MMNLLLGKERWIVLTEEILIQKIEFIKQEIEFKKQFIKSEKSDNRVIITVTILLFIAIFLLNINKKNLNVIDVFSVSLFTTSTYTLFDKLNARKRDMEFELITLEIDLKYHKSLLDKVNK